MAHERRGGDRPLVKNAGSERQVRRAARTETERSERFRDGLKQTLATPGGRAFIWGLLGEARVYESAWHDHGSRMAFNVGQQDFGHFIMAECIAADEAMFQLMEREGRAWQSYETKQASAAETAGDEGEQTNE